MSCVTCEVDSKVVGEILAVSVELQVVNVMSSNGSLSSKGSHERSVPRAVGVAHST